MVICHVLNLYIALIFIYYNVLSLLALTNGLLYTTSKHACALQRNVQVAICAWLPRRRLRDLCNDRVICSNTPWDQTLYCSKLYGHERFRDLSMIALCTLICLGIGLYTMHEPALTCTSMQESGKPWKHYIFQFVLESDFVSYFDTLH